MNLLPNEDELLRGIGGTFDSFTEVLCEFIDSAISIIETNNDKKVIISKENNEKEQYIKED